MLEVISGFKEEASRLKIAALTPFTTIDFPGCLSAVVFVRGCPWKCVYCQNPWMQTRTGQDEDISWESVLELLRRRQGLLDGVVFSGGEPCVDPALPSAAAEVKAMGYKVGLHTCGAYPQRLKETIGYLDWIGLDVKATLAADHYERVVQAPHAVERFLQSYELIRQSDIAYEARTTAHPNYLQPDEILKLAHSLADMGTTEYALQIYRKAPGMENPLDNVAADYPGEAVLAQLKGLFKKFTLRRG